MKVWFNGEESESVGIIGGGPQGMLLRQIEYLVQSNNNTDAVPEEDDLTILKMVCLSGLLSDYNIMHHVASGFGLGKKYHPSESYSMQDQLNNIANWTEENLMKLNEQTT